MAAPRMTPDVFASRMAQQRGPAPARAVPRPAPGPAKPSTKPMPALVATPAESLTRATPRFSRARGLALVARRALAGAGAGGHRTTFLGSSLEFAEHRDYQPGDDLRHLDWRAWGRTDRLLTRRFHDDRRLPVLLAVDLSASMAYGLPSKQRIARIAGAALALLAADQGDAVRVVIGERPVAPWSSGAPAALTAIHHLANADCAGAGDPAAVLAVAAREPRRSLLILISDALGEVPPLAKAMATAAGAGHELALIQVLDRSELALPADWGRSLLTDPEGVAEAVACDAAAAKRDYDAAIAAHLAGVQRACHAARADHCLAVTDQDPAAVLAGFLAARGRR
jgi:uncharacterized protein (DUF58 family)